MRRAVAALLGALLLTGCGLPLPSGVQAPGPVPEERQRPGGITVLPPGPAPGASARSVVIGFLAAQGSLEDDHGVARQFLTPEADREWDDRAGVAVYDATSPPLVLQTADPEVVTVTARVAAEVAADGSYRRAGGERTERLRVRCTDGPCRIAALDDGLRLNPDELVRSFAPRPVHFLAPPVAPARTSDHLVADLVWLPRLDEARGLVQAVLDGPSDALGASVRTAVPTGTGLSRVDTAPDGTVTVDLALPAAALDDRAREQLSAQLVWTLRALRTGFTRLRLLAGGVPLTVGGSDAPQTAGAWSSYDPERLPARTAAVYLDERRLRLLDDDDELPRSPATEGALPVDVVAASPDGRLALLTERPDGDSAVHTGPPGGPFEPRVVADAGSPTWGSGDRGLFLLRRGEVVLLPPEGDRLVAVPVDTSLSVRRLQVSRDGVRVALLVGDAERPSLLVGRLEDGAGGVRVVALREIAPGLSGVVDAAWETSTSLVVLASYPFGRLPGRVAVDGSSAPLLASRLPQGLTPVSLTAAAGRPVVLSGTVGGQPRLYQDNGSAFAPQGAGAAPAYPG